MATIRSWESPDDTTAIQRLASRLWPAGLHPGGLGWGVAIEQQGDPIALAEHADDVAGWASLDGDYMWLAADPRHPEAARALLDWSQEAGSANDRILTIFDGDDVVRAAALDAGFVAQPDAEPGLGMFHPAQPKQPGLPAGYTIRSVEDDEWAQRLECHRAAWLPQVFPWPPGNRPPIPPDVTSRFTGRLYEQVRRTWLYDQTLDLVVVAPDGTFAACCIAWWDAASGCAEIEPLGVVAAHRRKGLAGALCLDVVARVAARGGAGVFINSDPSAEYFVPSAAYAKAGFATINRSRSYCRPKLDRPQKHVATNRSAAQVGSASTDDDHVVPFKELA
jgi:GNAT superfamily N-acetyltransferase